MALAGEKFVVDFSDDEEEKPLTSTVGPKTGPSTYGLLDDFVGDIVEREPTAARPPAPPTFKSTTTGFPEHKKRSKFSTFKQQRAANINPIRQPTSLAPISQSTQDDPSAQNENASFEELERKRIDEENNQRLANMSETEIKQEREELLSSLSPDLLQAMLRRANLDDARGDTWTGGREGEARKSEEPATKTKATSSVDSEAVSISVPSAPRHTAAKTVTFAEDEAEPSDTGDLQTPSQFSRETATSATPQMHFPAPPAAPDLDPTNPSFLSDLHTKYFPDLPNDPSKLAWMAPVPTPFSPADRDSPYFPGSSGLNANNLRFDFRGALLPPRIARAMPTNKGLHHHGEAPESAGYTVSELARLARSAFPAQRCVAFQTLGRLLYRLGRGEYGHPAAEGGDGSEIAKGLWKCVEEGKVIESLEEAASVEGGHMGSKVYATEALWLYQKGGGKIWKAS